MDVRDEIRRKKLKDLLEREWQGIATDIEEQNDILAKNAEKYRKSIGDTRDKLDDLQKYMDDHANQLNQFTKDLEIQMENSMNLFHLTRRMEFQMTEERWGEFIWKLSRNFELQFEAMKTYYNDTTHSNLTLICTLQDLINESMRKRNLYQDQICEYQDLMRDADEKMPMLKKEYVRNRVKHDFIVRTRQGIKTTKREVAITLEDVNRKKGEFRSFKVELEAEEEVRKYRAEKNRLLGHFPNPESFARTSQPYKNLLDRRDEHLERQKLKHPTVTPEEGFVFGRASRLDWGPANLVAKKAYPTPMAVREKVWCPPPTEETEIKLCLTDSIRGFLAWKKGKYRKVPDTRAHATKCNSVTSLLGKPVFRELHPITATTFTFTMNFKQKL
ncbi:Growth arrest-specific protein 8 [Folsomia candida]|uniref:Growth arrest-specific protein 8 n=1 Tax=Folsomia candida TaxID=158441 RepID=A0A226DE39_FOLCA|nr:Growth arrest-specific protein 8 [Folsomia candida]